MDRKPSPLDADYASLHRIKSVSSLYVQLLSNVLSELLLGNYDARRKCCLGNSTQLCHQFWQSSVPPFSGHWIPCDYPRQVLCINRIVAITVKVSKCRINELRLPCNTDTESSSNKFRPTQ